MSLEILALFAILLSKAQKVLEAPTPAGAANEHQQAANQAAAQAADAAARGDHATASQKSAEAAAHQATAAQAAHAARTPPPWPQVVPAGLPPFPGAGWQPASPVTAAQSARAWQLLPELWKYGEGTWRTEKAGDRWTTFKAVGMPGGKKGVVAYTTNVQPAAAPGAPVDMPTAMHPAAPPVPRPPQGAPGPTVPASAAAPPPASGLPTLRPPPAAPARGPAVIALQQRLRVPVSGTYDALTISAVHAFQLQHPETGDRNGHPDNVVGPKMWAALGFGGAGGRAAA